LQLHLGERGPVGFSLDRPDRLLIDEQEVVHPAMTILEGELPDGLAGSLVEVHLGAGLHDPTRGGELPSISSRALPSAGVYWLGLIGATGG